MRDITFCINKECNSRTGCFRAEENYNNLDKGIKSYAMFNCNEQRLETGYCILSIIPYEQLSKNKTENII